MTPLHTTPTRCPCPWLGFQLLTQGLLWPGASVPLAASVDLHRPPSVTTLHSHRRAGRSFCQALSMSAAALARMPLVTCTEELTFLTWNRLGQEGRSEG